jgi:O-glycosyl hydrolase
MISRAKKTLSILLAIALTLPLLSMPASAANEVVVDLSAVKQTIRGFGGMNHAVWIGDLTPEQRETAFGNGENQLGFSVLRIPIHENRENWQREVETAKSAIEHGAIVFASPWNPPSEMVETFSLGMPSGIGTTYEAETNTTLNDAAVQSEHSGYNGSGYVEFQALTDASIQWNNVIIGSTGTKNLKFRYALETGTAYVDVYINGTLALEDVAFEATGSPATWSDKSIQVPMSVGNNNAVKLITTGTGGPNIDSLNATAFIGDPNAKRLKHDMYDEYAQYLNEFDTFMKNNGVNLHAISIQNEPDYAHDWTWWSAEEIVRFLKENAGSINTRVIAPESFSYVKNMSDPILNDPEALANMDILGAHLYGTSFNNLPYPLFEEKGAGKELWMTEVYYPNSDMTSGDRWPEALNVAEHMYNAMVEGNFQTYVWWYIRRGYGPMREDGTISKRGSMMAHYSKFVRPGYVRVEATKNPDPGVYVSAYKGDNKAVIVAVNKGNSEVSENFVLDNGAVSTVSSWVTDATRDLAVQSVIQSHNGAFTAQLPAQSVTTFVAEIADEPADHIPPVTALTIEGEGRSDWYRTPVDVTMTGEDEGTGLQHTYYQLNGGMVTEGTTVSITDEGESSLSYWSVDNAGNVEEARTITVKIDLTAPVISFSAQDGAVYGIDRFVTIGCLAEDALSGIVSKDCGESSAAAHELGVGTHTFTASAEDAAGNAASQSITVAVTVDFDSLAALTAQFVRGDSGIRNALVGKLNQAKNSAEQGNDNAMQGQLNAYINQANAQSGKALTEDQARVLSDLAQSLI